MRSSRGCGVGCVLHTMMCVVYGGVINNMQNSKTKNTLKDSRPLLDDLRISLLISLALGLFV